MEGSYWQTNTVFVLLRGYIIADRDNVNSGFSFSLGRYHMRTQTKKCMQKREVCVA